MKGYLLLVYYVIVMMNTVEAYLLHHSSSSSRSSQLFNKKTSNDDGNLGGNILSRTLFAATEVFGQITKGSSSIKNKSNRSNRRMTVEEVGEAIKKEYEQIFWATGNMDMTLWASNATFADPFSSFGGDGSLERFKANADNLGRFIINPRLRITSYSIDKKDGENAIIKVGWIYSSNLKLPWTPLLSAAGETSHYLNSNNIIVKYEEKWKSNPWSVVLRLLKPSTVNI